MNRAFWKGSAYFCLVGLGNQLAGVLAAQAPPVGRRMWGPGKARAGEMYLVTEVGSGREQLGHPGVGSGAASILDPGLAVGFIEVAEQVGGKEQECLVEVSGK